MAVPYLRGKDACVEAIVRTQISICTVQGPHTDPRTVNHDDYISRYRNTNFTREETLKNFI
jgi:hypothetical protein